MRIVLGVTGGIAAYKAAELARALQERAHTVEVVMTVHAQEFVRPLTFAALTGQKVITGMFGSSTAEATLESAIEHIALAQRCEALVVAPASADILAKFAHGLADDFLTTFYLAYAGPVVMAPAMNSNMWMHPATRANVEELRRRGARIVEPAEGYLACGMIGPGRMCSIDEIVAAVEEVLHSRATRRDLEGQTVLITAGPTREPLDPVRYLSNRSSGRMGFALAEEALARGARVIVVAGPTALPPPPGAEVIRVETAAEMLQAVMDRLESATIVIKAAAVADFRPAHRSQQKLKKAAIPPAIELEPTPDILAEIGRRKGTRFLVGFAAETGDLNEEAIRKLKAKNCDMVVANRVGRPDTGFDSEENEALIVTNEGKAIEFPRGSKRSLAARIFDCIYQLRLAHT
jgi:phosphopantothenoylcysteine decarboxylase/phosphopantothenate--cysteine ligase